MLDTRNKTVNTNDLGRNGHPVWQLRAPFVVVKIESALAKNKRWLCYHLLGRICVENNEYTVTHN